MFSHSYSCVRAYHNFGKRRKVAVLPAVDLTELEHAKVFSGKKNELATLACIHFLKQFAKDYMFLFWLSM
jgi:hypothetical protein